MSGDHHTLLGLNWWAWDPHHAPMGWFFLDFLAFLLLMAWFTTKPLRAALTERHQGMRRAVTQAAESHAKATLEHQTWSKKLSALDSEIRDIEQESLKDGEAEIARMLADAQAVAQSLRDEAKVQLAQETRRTEERLRKKVAQDMLTMAEAGLRRVVTQDDQTKLTDDAIAAIATAPDRIADRAHASLGRVS